MMSEVKAGTKNAIDGPSIVLNAQSISNAQSHVQQRGQLQISFAERLLQ
jgi:hypothetical protein